MARRLVRNHGWTVVNHEHFTPERIRRFVGARLPALADPRTAAKPEDVIAAVDAELVDAAVGEPRVADAQRHHAAS